MAQKRGRKDEGMKCRDSKCNLTCLLAIIGAIAAVAGIAALVVKLLMKNNKDKYCDCYNCECDDSDDDDFDDDDDDFVDEEEAVDEAPEEGNEN